jgi:hypothetical protein
MIPIKIQCGCGQRYAFDVEPQNGQMPGGVACPVCGVDGTPAANAALAQHLAALSVRVQAPAMAGVASPGGMPQVRMGSSAPTGVARVSTVAAAPSASRVATVTASPSPSVARISGGPSASGTASPGGHSPVPTSPRLPGQMDRGQAEIEARAKVMWGDDPEDVKKFVLMQGFTRDEATAMLAEMLDDRAQTIRKNGVRKIFIGIGMMCVPVVAFIVFTMIHFFEIKIFGATLVIGLWGAWRVLSGTIMFLSPRSEKGDVADQ